MLSTAGKEVRTPLLAVRLTKVAGDTLLGVPDITPVLEFKVSPAGSGAAEKDIGDLEAVMVYGLMGVKSSNTRGVKELVITGLC
jgi:hypothetical protein